MNDQQQLWEEHHRKGRVNHLTSTPTSFARIVLNQLKQPSVVLDLGCGVGNDSVAFAKEGHTVLALDFAKTAIEKNQKEYSEFKNLTFKQQDITKLENIENNSIDIVYARLSLHYFSDSVTKQLFKKIHRVLKPDGLLCFMCKSVADPKYGRGVKIEKDLFLEKNHLRHFFSKPYVIECLGDDFSVIRLEEGEEIFYQDESAYIQVIAKAIKNIL